MKTGHGTMRWMPVAVALVAAGLMLRAADAPADQSYRVAVTDLDLRSAAGAEALYGRLQTAARAVCGFDQAHGVMERRQSRRCVAATLDAVVADLGRSPAVSGQLGAQHRLARNQPAGAGAVERLAIRSP